MWVTVTGATGFLGRRLVSRLLADGHGVRALSRDVDAARERLPEGSVAFAWDGAETPPPASALRGSDAVIHLAGEPVAGRWSAAKRRAIRQSRELGTRRVVEGLARLSDVYRPPVLVCASAVGFYGDRGDEELSEDAPPGSDFLAGVCRAWEYEAQQAEALGVRVVRVRFGVVLGPEGGALAEMLPLYRKGLGGRLGSGRQWWSWIHADDAVGVLCHAAEEPVAGALNATAPHPTQQRDFAQALAGAVGKRTFLPAPGFALRLALGGFASELLSSKRVLPRRTQESGYTFRFPTLSEALTHLLGYGGRAPAEG